MRREPVELLDVMTQMIVPKRMWFTNFTANDNKVIISGIAMDHKTVADFMTSLEKVGLFSSVNLKTLNRAKVQGLNLKRFEVNCNKKRLNGNPKSAEKKK